MRVLTNPLFLRSVFVLAGSVGAFVIGIFAIRMLRREIVEDGDLKDHAGPEQTLPLQAYAVIQQLKQQKFELQSEQQVQRRRAKTSEHVTAAIIANLPCGTLFIAPNGLVRQANAAARNILGFASPLGMNTADLFRETRTFAENGRGMKLAEIFEAAARGKSGTESFEAWYAPPSGEQRSLRITVVPVFEPSGDPLGLVVLVSDESTLAAMRQADLLQNEEAAEMALELRTSLSTIREWTAQAGAVEDKLRMRDFAQDIVAETQRIEKIVGGFLAGNKAAKGAHA